MVFIACVARLVRAQGFPLRVRRSHPTLVLTEFGMTGLELQGKFSFYLTHAPPLFVC